MHRSVVSSGPFCVVRVEKWAYNFGDFLSSRSLGGGTENARLENAERSKMHGRKTQYQTAGLVNAGKGMYGKPNGVLHM